MPSVVLGCICLAVALLLSVINMFTAPIIAQRQSAAANEALLEVLPNGKDFKEIEITSSYPSIVKKGWTADGGSVFQMEVIGYASGLVIMCGVDAEGKIAGVKHIASNETFGAEGELNGAYTSKKDTIDSLELILSASASKGAPMTASAYYKAVDAALEAALIASGKKVEDIYPGVESMQIDDNGNYVFVSYGDGYAGKIRLEVSIDMEGKIVSVKTLSHNETDGYGADVLDNSAFHDQLIGKDNGTFSGVENTTGATAPVTINGYKEAIRNAFAAFEALVEEGGDQ
jgi:Na+-translocating ferredoxin:NAD+ oxidoreductase RnfG subunit